MSDRHDKREREIARLTREANRLHRSNEGIVMFNEKQHGVSRLTSKPHRCPRNALVELYVRPQIAPILVGEIHIQSPIDADHWKLVDVRVGAISLRMSPGTRFLEYPIFGSSSGNLIPYTLVNTAQDFRVEVIYVGPDPVGDVFYAQLAGKAVSS